MLGVFYFLIYLSYMKKIVRLTESDLIRIVKRVISEQPEKQDVEMGLKPFIGLPLGLISNRRDSDIIRELKMISENVLKVTVSNPPQSVGSNAEKKDYYFVCKPNLRKVDIMDANRSIIKTVEVDVYFNMDEYAKRPNYIKLAYSICLPMNDEEK